MESDVKRIIVLDTGTSSVKCGLSGSWTPSITPNVIGKSVISSKSRLGAAKLLVGQDSIQAMDGLKFEYPLEGGLIRKWECMHLIWTKAFQNLGLSSSDGEVMNQYKLFATESPFGLPNKEDVVQVSVAGCCLLLIRNSKGFKTGIVVEAGESNTSVCPVYESIALNPFAKRLAVGGRQLTDHLIQLLALRGYGFNPSVDREKIRLMKENVCYVAHDVVKEMQLAEDTVAPLQIYKLVNGPSVTLGEERFTVPEALFQPHVIGQDGVGLAELTYDVIQSTDMTIRRELRQHILLSGGTSMLPGIGTRLEKDLIQLILERIFKGNVHRLEVRRQFWELEQRITKEKQVGKELELNIEDCHPLRKYSVFIGASKLADQKKDRESFWVSLKKYEEEGYDRVSQKLIVHAV